MPRSHVHAAAFREVLRSLGLIAKPIWAIIIQRLAAGPVLPASWRGSWLSRELLWCSTSSVWHRCPPERGGTTFLCADRGLVCDVC